MFCLQESESNDPLCYQKYPRVFGIKFTGVSRFEVSSDFLVGLSDCEIQLCTFTNMVMAAAFTRNPLTSFVVS